ncbi:MAG: ABC transporter permease [Armatimonadota bacterium]|nr:ABC transporter permease [Armatimonadota bacterium]MDR7457116.1 ABC transporter permease [Armatimonadota bacterium]MDR7496590.1 ABC transporter permease [Armatimonadota bacterium]MDR7510612.1 ABC transporter permease [Armatimonadota bacterium]
MSSAAVKARLLVGRYYSLVVVLAAWELLARSGAVNPRLFPTLDAIGSSLWAMTADGTLATHLGATLLRVFAGFGLAAVAGVALGVVMARLPAVGRVIEPLFSLGYPIPRVALYPVFVFLFGLGHLSKVALIFLECLYPVAIHTYSGCRDVDRLYLWSAASMGARPARVFARVVLPAASPAIFTGLRIALPVALVIAVLTEMIGSTRGLGWLLTYATAALSRPQAFAGVAAIAAVGFALDRLLVTARTRLLPWEHEAPPIAAGAR